MWYGRAKPPAVVILGRVRESGERAWFRHRSGRFQRTGSQGQARGPRPLWAVRRQTRPVLKPSGSSYGSRPVLRPPREEAARRCRKSYANPSQQEEGLYTEALACPKCLLAMRATTIFTPAAAPSGPCSGTVPTAPRPRTSCRRCRGPAFRSARRCGASRRRARRCRRPAGGRRRPNRRPGLRVRGRSARRQA